MTVFPLNFPAPAPNARQPFAGTAQQNPKPKAKVWMNIGYEVHGKFVNLPLGLAIDTMEPADVRGQNEDFVKLRTAQNEFLAAVQAIAWKLAPGGEQDLNLIVRLRRVNEALDISKSENEYAMDFSTLIKAAE